MMTTMTGVLATALAFGSVAQAHMMLSYPLPYRSKDNPNSVAADIDYSMTAPLSGAAQFPCKGYHSDFGTAAGASVATWPAGASTKFTVEGGAPHGGGSCQASLSYDKGATFTVVTSFVGSCPLASGDSFDFTVPSDAPTGDAIFAWTWFNKIGNREIYMNCATVTISGGVGKAKRADTAFSARPQVFQANLGNGCSTVEGKEVIFPSPGPDVVDKETGDNTGSLTGCGDSTGSGSSGSSGAGTSAAAPAASTAVSSSAAVATLTGGVFGEQPATTATPDAATTAAATAVPTTLATLVSPVASATSVVISASSAVSSAVASAAPSNGTTSGALSGACSTEGEWNCIGGTSFQQCASGSWSVVMQVAAGTQCTPGQSSVIDISATS